MLFKRFIFGVSRGLQLFKEYARRFDTFPKFLQVIQEFRRLLQTTRRVFALQLVQTFKPCYIGSEISQKIPFCEYQQQAPQRLSYLPRPLS